MKKLLLTTIAGLGFTLCAALWVVSSQNNLKVNEEKNCNAHCTHEHKKHEDARTAKTGCMLEEGESHYLAYIHSYEKDTIDGTLDIAVIIEAEDTSYIGNVITFEMQGSFFSGGDIFHTNRDSLMPGDTLMFHFSVSYNVDSVPFYPADLYFSVKDSLNGDTTRREFISRAKVYFTPWNTAEVWDFDDFHGLNRVWLAKGGNPERVYINKNSLPISDITTDTIPDDAFYRQIDGLAYAIPFIEPDTFNWDYPYDTTGGAMMIPGGGRNVDRRADGCGWWRRDFTARIQNFRFFSWYTPPGGTATQVWLKNATVKVYVDRWPSSKVADLRTDDEG